LEEVEGIILDGADFVFAEEGWEDAFHDGAVFQDVADAAGGAAVVFEDEVFAVLVADEVGAADMDVDIAGDVHAEHLAAEHFGAVDQFGRNDAASEDVLLVVDVLAEEIEGGDALDEAAFDGFPFGGWDDAGDEVEGEYFLDATGVAVDGESDALVAEGDVGHTPAALDGLLAEGLESGGDGLVMGAWFAGRREHLVEDAVDFITVEHDEKRSPRWFPRGRVDSTGWQGIGKGGDRETRRLPSAGFLGENGVADMGVVMRGAGLVLGCLVLWCSCARGQEFKGIAPDASVDQVLDALKVRGDTLHTFRADVTLTTVDQSTGDSSGESGTVIFQRFGDGDGRIRVDFTRSTRGDRTFVIGKHYTLQKGWLIDRDDDKKTEDRKQVTRPGEKINLLKLGDGPFPLPIGQDKQEVYKDFDVGKPAAAKDDPAGTVHIRLKPKAQADLSRHFAQIDVWVDVKTGMPVRMVTLDAAGVRAQTTDLNNVRLDVDLKDGDFDLTPVEGYQVTEEPYEG
jgi:outer membrane lipoprotein-sorting protein